MLLENGTAHIDYDLERSFCGRYTGLDRVNSTKLKEAMTVDNNNKNEVEYPRKKHG